MSRVDQHAATGVAAERGATTRFKRTHLDVHGEDRVLRGRRDRKRVPLHRRHVREHDLDVHSLCVLEELPPTALGDRVTLVELSVAVDVTVAEGESDHIWPLQDHLPQQHPLPALPHAVHEVEQKRQARPEPEDRAVEHQAAPEDDEEVVGQPECLEGLVARRLLRRR